MTVSALKLKNLIQFKLADEAVHRFLAGFTKNLGQEVPGAVAVIKTAKIKLRLQQPTRLVEDESKSPATTPRTAPAFYRPSYDPASHTVVNHCGRGGNPLPPSVGRGIHGRHR